MKYWAVAPYRNQRTLPGARTWHPSGFEETWDFCVRNKVIAIGWHQVGDLTGLTRSEIKGVYKQVFEGERTRGHVNLQRFWVDVNPGDRVVARYGKKIAVGFGTVLGTPYYDQQKGEDWACGLSINPHPNFVPVRWDSLMEHSFSNAVFSRFTISELKATLSHWSEIEKVLAGVW